MNKDNKHISNCTLLDHNLNQLTLKLEKFSSNETDILLIECNVESILQYPGKDEITWYGPHLQGSYSLVGAVRQAHVTKSWLHEKVPKKQSSGSQT